MFAFGFACLADVAAVEKEPVMGFGDDLRGDVSDELFLGLQRVLAIRGQPEAFADAEDMRIDRHRRLVPDDGAHHVRGFASHALERLQLLYCVRHFAVIDLRQALRHLNEVFGFGAGITDRLDVFEDLIAGRCGEGFRRGVGGKKSRRDHVHTFVGALRREHYRHQALERVGKMQLALRYRHVRLKPRENMLESISCLHCFKPFLLGKGLG